ncbi:MAG: N-acetyltransferase family protein [Bacteroidota bacterium]|nr:N-acetyltransferase family protein [Bacteroidota bacterium]
MFREATETDLPGILDIMNEAIENTTAIYDYNPRSYEYVVDWYFKKKSENMPVFVCASEDQTIGYGTYGIFRSWDAYKFSVEHSIYVHKDYRGNGIGKVLMTHLINQAKKDGFHTMIAGIDALNVNSCKFHEQFGFFEVARFKEVGFKFNKWLDLVFMQLMLE